MPTEIGDMARNSPPDRRRDRLDRVELGLPTAARLPGNRQAAG